ncbi:MAG: hypothetical protein Phog2KO_10220 [Phototrophicaceae bacterium]
MTKSGKKILPRRREGHEEKRKDEIYMSTHKERLERARLSLDGLSLGDSLGGFLEGIGSQRAKRSHIVANRQVPNVEWHYTDDTNMALSIYSILRQYQEINSDELALSFAKYYDRSRGYGAGVRRMMARIRNGDDWRDFNTTLYDGGSFGNGGAMRVAPVGAYFADDMTLVIENARRSSEITHAHPEGVAGAITIAVASAIACNLVGQEKPTRSDFINLILPHIPDSEVKNNVTTARDIAFADNISEIVAVDWQWSWCSRTRYRPLCFVLCWRMAS